MFAAAYRNTERSIRERVKPSEGLSQMARFNAEQQARKEARHIIDEARGEAEKIVKAAEVKAESMIAEAVTRVGKILGLAGMESSENKQPVIDIIRIVAAKHGVSVTDIKSQTRTLHIVEARHEAMALVYQLRPDLSLPAIGRVFGRDHTTVLHAARKLGVFRGDKGKA